MHDTTKWTRNPQNKNYNRPREQETKQLNFHQTSHSKAEPLNYSCFPIYNHRRKSVSFNFQMAHNLILSQGFSIQITQITALWEEMETLKFIVVQRWKTLR
jgi:hypothetical protein